MRKKLLFFITIAILAGSTLSVLAFDVSPTKYHILEPEIFGDNQKSFGSLAEFLKNLFTVFLSLTIVIAVLSLIFAGVKYVLSTTPFGKGDGKALIQDALTGLLIALVAWLILNTINPEIKNWNIIQQSDNPAAPASQPSSQ